MIDTDTHRYMEWAKEKRLSKSLSSRGQAQVYRVQVEGIFGYFSMFFLC